MCLKLDMKVKGIVQGKWTINLRQSPAGIWYLRLCKFNVNKETRSSG